MKENFEPFNRRKGDRDIQPHGRSKRRDNKGRRHAIRQQINDLKDDPESCQDNEINRIRRFDKS